MATAFPHLCTLISGGALAKTKYATMSAEALLRSAAPYVQRNLSMEHRVKAVEDVLKMTADPVLQAHILSCATPEASGWLAAMPGSGRGLAVLNMTDDQFGLALRARLGLPILPEGCRCICSVEGPLLSTSGDHTFSCTSSNLKGGRSTTHAGVLCALEGVLRSHRTLSNGMRRIIHEPSLRDHGFVPKVAGNVGADGKSINSRGDVLVIDDTHPLQPLVIDLVISAVSCHCPAASVTAGAAAAAARERKISEYDALWTIPAGSFLPFSMEDDGRIEPKALAWLKSYVRASCSGGNFSRSLSFGLQRISVALQRAVANRRRKLINLAVRPVGAAPVGA
jgi:hypothetical protein